MTRASVWLIAGPTASGKSRLALALAERVGAEIVNADSMQVYREIAILTARPGPEDLARAPHHLYGVASAAEPWSVGRWLRAVEPVLQDIAARGRAAIVVGGTGLYFRALTEGLSDIPSPPTALREAVEAAYRSDGEASVRARLGALDAAAEARIASGDRQRLVRALSVVLATGRALSDWQAETATPSAPHWAGLVLDPPRAALYARCDARLGAMVEGGALEEVRRLMALGLGPGLPAAKALGAPEFAAHLRGEIDLEMALSAARQATRRYAKRQTTWFRNQTSAWPRLTEWDLETAARTLGVSL